MEKRIYIQSNLTTDYAYYQLLFFWFYITSIKNNCKMLNNKMNLPLEMVKDICDYAGICCYICEKQLYPWNMISNSQFLLCTKECYL